MRALAEFIMKGRTQAVIVSVLGVGSLFFSWVSAAAIALVTLRKGFTQGSYVLLWALLPAVVLAYTGRDAGPMAVLLGSMLAAVVLRHTVSLPLALSMASVSGVLMAVVMSTLGAGQIAAVQELLGRFIEQMQTQQGAQQAVFSMPEALDIAGLVGMSNAVTVALCLLLARWWQATLYNPGGFREEFHKLRMSSGLVLLLLGAAVVCNLISDQLRLWGWIFIVPVQLAGLALIHGLVSIRGLGQGWLVMTYLAWLLLPGVKVLLLLVAVLDSRLDFRQRYAPRGD